MGWFMKHLLLSFIMLSVVGLAHAQDCATGYEWRRMSGVGCVQVDCESVPDAHYGYTGACVCGSSGSIEENPDDPNVACRRGFDYKDCPGCVYACVHAGENCPGDLTPRVGLPEDYGDDEEDDGIDEGYVQSEEEREELIKLSKEYIVQPKPKANVGAEVEYSVDELDENACTKEEYAVFYQHKRTGELFASCACKPGFRRGETRCELDRPDIGLEGWDVMKLENALRDLDPNQNTIVEVEIDGKKMKIGIVRKTDYGLAYTLDGKRWDSNLKDLIDPSLWTRTKNGWNSMWGALNPINWFDWHAKYKDEDKEMKWQVADATLKRYGKDVTKPQHYMYAVEFWYKYAEDKRKAAITLRDNGFLDGSLDLTKDYAWNDLKGHLETFPANAVHKMAAELRTDDFAQAFSIYANMRKTKTPAQIMHDPGEELDIAISAGTASLFGDVLLYQKYEEAYQRYLLVKAMGGNSTEES